MLGQLCRSTQGIRNTVNGLLSSKNFIPGASAQFDSWYLTVPQWTWSPWFSACCWNFIFQKISAKIANHVQRQNNMKILIGFILGVIVSTVGFSGITRILDHGVETVKNQSQELAK